jgi:hypothetical protein
MFTRLPDSLHVMPSTSWDTAIVSKMGPTIVVGLPKLRVLRKNLPTRSVPPRANRARDKVTQWMSSSWCYPRPHRRDSTSLSFVSESLPGGFLHTPSCGVASSHSGSPNRVYLEMMLKPPGLNLLGGGGICPYLVLWRSTCPPGSHPPMVTQTPLRS